MPGQLVDCLRRPVLHYPDKVAIIDGECRLTYRQLGSRVHQLANGLKSLGVAKGDVIAALCMNHHRYLEIFFACHSVGAIIVPLNTRLKESELLYILNDSGSRLLFIDQPFLSMVERLRADARHLGAIYYSDADETPRGLQGFDELLEGQPTAFQPVETDEDDVAGYFYTGGTTGEPKGVMLTARNLVANAFHGQSLISLTHNEVYLHIAPMFHLADLSILYTVTMMGGTHVFGRAFDPELTLRLIEEHRVTCLILVPTMVNFVLNHEDFHSYDLSSLRHMIYGASPMPLALLKRVLKEIPGLPVQGYGMTEAAPLVTVLSADEHQLANENKDFEWLLSTAGRAIPGVQLKVVDENDQEVPIGSTGEIVVRGPNLMKGYLNKPEATKAVLYDGWYHSGDIAVRNELGYVTIVDRKNDMIIRGGENIYTIEVENVLMQFDGILETTVIGVPDDTWGEVPIAFVVLASGCTANDVEIIEFCRQRLAHFKCPQSVKFVDALPKSGAGKILKRELREGYWDEGRQVH